MTEVKKLIPHLFTAGNLVGGILAIILTLNGNVDWAPYCIFGSAILDFLDGFVARLLKVQGELGKQLDSLADMVTFGVAPGLILYEVVRHGYIFESVVSRDYIPSSWSMFFPTRTYQLIENAPDWYSLGADNHFSAFYFPYICLLIPIFAMFRLAKFNIDSKQADSFIGLPTPAMTIFIAALPLMIVDGLSNTESWKYEFTQNILLGPEILMITGVILAVMMVVPLPLFALKFKSFGWKGNEIRYIFLTISAVLLATLLWWALPLIIILYLILSVIIRITQKPTNEIHS